jgi:hypothetical protein
MSKNTSLSALINYVSANSSGNVVVAAPSSGYALDVTGTGRFTSGLTAASFSTPATGTSGSTTWNFYHDQYAAGDFGIWAGSTNRLLINAAGNVGIGTTAPSEKLHLNNASGAGVFIRFEDTGGSGVYLGGRNNNMELYAGGTECMRITATGNVGIGASSIANGTVFGGGGQVNKLKLESSGYTCLEINGNTSGGSLQFTYDLNTPNSVGAFLGYNYGSGTVKDFALIQRLSGGTVTVASFSNGVYLASGGVAWIAASDERLKTDLVPIENATNKVSQLRSVIGRYKTDKQETKRAFLIAQDVQKVLPEAVNLNEETGDLGVSYTDIIPLLVASIKEQQAQIEELKQLINN